MPDYLDGRKFVLLTAVQSLPRAEAIRDYLRKNNVAALITGDEEVQNRPRRERKDAEPAGSAFRVEVAEDQKKDGRELLDKFLTMLKRRGNV